MERGHDMLYVCFDNEAYMNTGIQRSSGTPFSGRDDNGPGRQEGPREPGLEEEPPRDHGRHTIPYVATATPSYPIDFMNKVKKARRIKGPAYIHCFVACPTGWRSASETCIKVGRLALETGLFPCTRWRTASTA